MHTDVPLGSFLSGGVDSPVVNAVLKKLGHKMNAFTISTKYLGIDESENAKMISNYLGIKHSIKTLKWEEITTL